MNRRTKLLIATAVLFLSAGAAFLIIQRDLPYQPVDLAIIVGLFPVLLALRNVNLSAGFTPLLKDPINLSLLLGSCGLIGGLLLHKGVLLSTSLLAAGSMIPAYGLLIWIAGQVGRAGLGFGFFNATIALFFLPLALNDSSLAAWNPFAPTWYDLATTDFHWPSVAFLVAYVAAVIWLLPFLLRNQDNMDSSESTSLRT